MFFCLEVRKTYVSNESMSNVRIILQNCGEWIDVKLSVQLASNLPILSS